MMFSKTRNIFEQWARIFALGLLYFCAGKFGLGLALIHPSASAIWPPSGIAVAALLLLGLRAWPGVALGAFFVNVTNVGTAMTSASIATGNTLEALIGAWLIGRFARGRYVFERGRDVLRFALIAIIATTVAATVGALTLRFTALSPSTDFEKIWRTWWLGDASGVLTLAPLFLTWAAHPHRTMTRKSLAELGSVLLALCVGLVAIFWEWVPTVQKGYPLLLLMLPILLWIAFRFSQRETALAVFAISAIAVAGTTRASGPFSIDAQNESLLYLQAFLGTISVMSMTLTAAVQEQRAGEQRLEAQQSTTRILAESETLAHAMPRILAATCVKLDWEIGIYWRLNEAGDRLQCHETYALAGIRATEFIESSQRMLFPRGIGMPGRAWDYSTVVWIDDVIRDDNFPRAHAAERARLHSAFAIPIIVAGNVRGVLEFFTREFRGSKNEVARMAETIAGQITQFAERKNAEELMKQSEALYRTMAETASDTFLTIDENFAILFVNRAAERTFGYHASELVGQKLNRLMSARVDADLSGLRVRLEGGYDSSRSQSWELEGHCKDGGRLPLEVSFGSFKANGRHLFTAIARDVSERKRAAEALQREKAAAEQANQVKDNFLAMLSHELRTPLTPVICAINDLEQALPLSPEARASVAIVRRNVEHEARLIDDLLDLTRVVRGKLNLRCEVLDAHGCIMDALDACQQDIARKEIKIQTALEAPRHHVHADRTKLHQIVWNLVKNAAKFSDVGGIVSLTTENDEDGQLVLKVIDHGIGIEPDLLHRIFIPFEQGGTSMHRRFGGLGLGLAVSKAIAEAHGGSLAAASDGANRGATLTLKLALAELRDEPPLAVQEEPPATIGHIPPVRVLLVEDHEDTRCALERFLRRRHYEVTSANTVEAALKFAEEFEFDVVVSDIGLPDRSGLELIRTLKARRPIKGIAISGFGMEGDFEKSRAAGFSEHLLKPINPVALDAAIRNLLAVAVRDSA
jgi:PAS domain S-box-containing protein